MLPILQLPLCVNIPLESYVKAVEFAGHRSRA